MHMETPIIITLLLITILTTKLQEIVNTWNHKIIIYKNSDLIPKFIKC